jgi:Zn-finger nucleic acid-binding protein
VAFSVLFHFALAALLFGAANARSEGSGAAAGEENAHPRRRGGYAEQAMRDRRQIEGPYPRLRRFGEGRMDRREALYVRGRRSPFDESGRPYRFLELPSGRRDLAGAQRAKVRSIDFGPADEQILMAMVIPKLGRKKAVKGELPKLTKYEQPERVEDGINVSRDNPDGSPMRFKEFKRKKSQYDRRRKKAPTLDDLIDAPDDRRPSTFRSSSPGTS